MGSQAKINVSQEEINKIQEYLLGVGFTVTNQSKTGTDYSWQVDEDLTLELQTCDNVYNLYSVLNVEGKEHGSYLFHHYHILSLNQMKFMISNHGYGHVVDGPVK